MPVPPGLTREQKARYTRDGLLFPVPLLSDGEVRRYAQHCDELERLLGGKPRTVEVRQMHLHFDWAYELATLPLLLDKIEDLLGPNLLIWATELFAKHPHDEAIAIGWHRDAPYMGIADSQVVTAWIALSDSQPSNGCMRALPRSVERSRMAAPAPGVDALAGRTCGHEPPGVEADAIDVVLGPGELSLHAADVLHGSGANRSQGKRVGLVVRYVTPAARPLRGRPPVLLARGDAGECPFEVVGPPRPMGSEESLAALKVSAGRHLNLILDNLQEQSAKKLSAVSIES
jgi:hypothetical protein